MIIIDCACEGGLALSVLSSLQSSWTTDSPMADPIRIRRSEGSFDSEFKAISPRSYGSTPSCAHISSCSKQLPDATSFDHFQVILTRWSNNTLEWILHRYHISMSEAGVQWCPLWRENNWYLLPTWVPGCVWALIIDHLYHSQSEEKVYSHVTRVITSSHWLWVHQCGRDIQ